MKKGIKRLLAATAAAGMLFAALPAYAVSVDQVIDADESTEAPDTSDAINVSDIDIAEGGKFVITYTCECETSMALVLRDGEWGSWSQYNTPDSKYETNGVYYAEYGYSTVVSGWQGEDIADITYASAKTWGAWDDELKVNVSKEATVLSIDWVTDKAPETTGAPDTTEAPDVTADPEQTEIPIVSNIDINEVIDADDSTEAADMTGNIDISHTGIGERGRFRITYSCENETSIALVLRDSEWNGWTQYNTPDNKGMRNGLYYVDFTYETLLKEWQGDDFSDVTYANVKTWGIWDGELEKNVSRTAEIRSIEWIDDDDLYTCDISMDNDTVTYSSTWAEGETYDVYVAVYDADGHLLKLEMDKASGAIAAEGAAYARVYFWSKDMTGLRDVITASKGKIGDDISGE